MLGLEIRNRQPHSGMPTHKFVLPGLGHRKPERDRSRPERGITVFLFLRDSHQAQRAFIEVDGSIKVTHEDVHVSKIQEEAPLPLDCFSPCGGPGSGAFRTATIQMTRFSTICRHWSSSPEAGADGPRAWSASP